MRRIIRKYTISAILIFAVTVSLLNVSYSVASASPVAAANAKAAASPMAAANAKAAANPQKTPMVISTSDSLGVATPTNTPTNTPSASPAVAGSQTSTTSAKGLSQKTTSTGLTATAILETYTSVTATTATPTATPLAVAPIASPAAVISATDTTAKSAAATTTATPAAATTTASPAAAKTMSSPLAVTMTILPTVSPTVATLVKTPEVTPTPFPIVAPITPVLPTTIGIIGDSRTCSLLVTMCQDPTWTNLFVEINREGNLSRAAFKKGNLTIAICGEAKGNYQDGSATRTFLNLVTMFDSVKELKDIKEVKMIDLFGVNDAWMQDKSAPDKYITFDSHMKDTFEICSKVYHCTAGPINPDGTVWSYCNNTAIKKFNNGFKANDDVDIIDLYDYLIKAGYEAPLTEIDSTGLHYDVQTDSKILNYLITLLSGE